MANLTEVHELHDEGATVLEISNITGMKRPLIYYWLGKWNTTPNINRRPTLTPTQIGTIYKMYLRDGLSKTEIARKLDVPVHQVRYATKSMKRRK